MSPRLLHRLAIGLTVIVVLLNPPRTHAQDTDPEYEEIMHIGRGAINTLEWSPNGSLLAVGGDVGVWVYTDALGDVALLDSAGGVDTLAWSPDGSRLISCGGWYGTPFQMWDTAVWQPVAGWPDSTCVPVIAWSPDGSQIALGGSSIRVLDANSGSVVLTLRHGVMPIRAITWSQDGSRLIGVAGFERSNLLFQVSIWDAATGQLLSMRGNNGNHAKRLVEGPAVDSSEMVMMGGFVFGPFWQFVYRHFIPLAVFFTLFIICAIVVLVIAARSKKLTGIRKKLAISGLIFSIFLVIAVGLYSAFVVISIWFYSFPSQGDMSTAVAALNADASHLATGGWYGSVEVWDVATGMQVASTNDEGADSFAIAYSVDWNPSGYLLAIGGLNAAYIWDEDTQSLQSLWLEPSHGFTATDVAWHPDGNRLAVIYQDDRIGSRLAIWDTANQQILVASNLHVDGAGAIKWHPYEDRIAGCLGGAVYVWNAQTGETVWKYEPQSIRVQHLAWSPNGQFLLLTGSFGQIAILDGQTGVLMRNLQSNQSVYSETGAVWSPDGVKIVGASQDTQVTIWNVADGQTLYRLTGHTRSVTAVEWSPDGHFVATGSDDNTVRIWDASTGAEVAILERHEAPVNDVAWSPDSQQIASSGNDDAVVVMDMATASTSTYRIGNWATGVSWSPDGGHILVASRDHVPNDPGWISAVRVLDAATGNQMSVITEPPLSFFSATRSPDGTRVAGVKDGVVVIWQKRSQP